MTTLLPERRQARAPERFGVPFPETWEPFVELEQMTERMRRMLDETFSSLAAWPTGLLETVGWSPLVDLEELEDAYVLEAELPGVKREDIDIELIGNELAITGELKERERKGVLRRRTRRTGRFAYRVRLPEPVKADEVEAKLADGVLTVRIPKAERAERKKIEIKGS